MPREYRAIVTISKAEPISSAWDTYVNECGRDDDTRAELLQNDEECVELGRHHLVEEDRSKDTNSAGGENDEQKTNSQANVVFPVRGFASDGFRVSFIGFTVSGARLVVGGGLGARETYSTPAWKWQCLVSLALSVACSSSFSWSWPSSPS